MKKTLFFITLILLGLKVASQNLDCKDFKNGTFIVTIEQPSRIVSKVIRRGNNQTEIILEKAKELENSGLPNKVLLKLNWIDKCTYVITLNPAKSKSKGYNKFINDNGGILVEKIKIEDRCMYYRSTLKIEDESIVTYGKMCKE